MPNHVANKVFFECSDEKAKEIKTAVMYDPEPDKEDYTGIGTIDFNKLIPMPPALMIECGSETENGISLYLTAINPDTPDYDLPKMPKEQFNDLLARLNAERMFTRYNGNLSSEEIEKYTKYSSFGKLADLGKQAVNNLINYSATTWYDWCVNNWGTKWNSYDPRKGEDNGLMFSTAWSAPHPVIEELSVRFPGVYITHEWADEDMGNNCGRREYLNGECVGEYIPTADVESMEFACSVWGDSPEDYGLVKSADGTEYVRTDCDSYEVVDLFGKPALFTNERMSESDIPAGLYVCHVRGDDLTTGGFAELAPKVLVNHYGSIITKEPIDFGEKGYIAFTEETDPHFTGESATFAEFMKDDFDIGDGEDPGADMMLM